MIEVLIHYPVARVLTRPGDPLQPSSDKVKIEFVLPKRPFLFWSDYHVAEELKFPKGYGVAYYDAITHRVLMAPMPFNVLIAFLIWCYQWTRYGAEYWFIRHLPKHKTNQ